MHVAPRRHPVYRSVEQAVRQDRVWILLPERLLEGHHVGIVLHLQDLGRCGALELVEGVVDPDTGGPFAYVACCEEPHLDGQHGFMSPALGRALVAAKAGETVTIELVPPALDASVLQAVEALLEQCDPVRRIERRVAWEMAQADRHAAGIVVREDLGDALLEELAGAV